MFVYTIEPVVKRLSNWFDNWLYRVYKHSTGCQTCLTTGLTNGCIVYTAGCQTGCTAHFDNWWNEQLPPSPLTGWTNSLFLQHGCQTRLTTGCIVYRNIQLVVKPVWLPVGCLFTWYSRLSNRLYNWLYRVNGYYGGYCQPGVSLNKEDWPTRTYV